MIHIFERDNAVYTYNPFNHYQSDFDLETFRSACGLIAHWLETYPSKSLLTRIEDNYDFGIGFKERPEVTIDDELGYHYPEDPVLYPYLQVRLGTQELLMYPHALVLYRKDYTSPWLHQRCD